MYTLILFIIFIIIILYLYCYLGNDTFINIKPNTHNHTTHHHTTHNINTNLVTKADIACSEYITDIEYLEHMIPHHQVAIDISRILQNKTQSDYMQSILRKLIYIQEHDIMIMQQMLIKLSGNISDSTHTMNKKYIDTVANFTKPNSLGLTKVYCDPLFFDETAHMNHLQMSGLINTLDDTVYIEHMIPHHQVAVDMSKKLLKNTTNDFMIYLCYRIIRNQEEEVILLNDIFKSKFYKWQSTLIL